MPPHETIDKCVHKYKSYLAFKKKGLKVPKNILLKTKDDLKRAFTDLTSNSNKIWLRSATIGGGGKGSIPTSDINMATAWLDHYKGWGEFIAAEKLSEESITWLSIWYQGELIVAQTRKRRGWEHGNRSISGVTGVTKVGCTCKDSMVDNIAISACKAISEVPHGIFGVDMTFDQNWIPNPTEINISRFFTTIRFFTEAGLNMPLIFRDLALESNYSYKGEVLNPLQDNLLWLRCMDGDPKLIKDKDLKSRFYTV